MKTYQEIQRQFEAEINRIGACPDAAGVCCRIDEEMLLDGFSPIVLYDDWYATISLVVDKSLEKLRCVPDQAGYTEFWQAIVENDERE
jgi:hypothetical protein